MKDKTILLSMTAVIDFLLLYIMFIENNTIIDKLFINITLFCHVIFYYALSIENKFLLDILHVFVFILSLFAVFVKNKHIKLVIIGLLISIQTLWIIKETCILHNFPTNFLTLGYGKYIEIFVRSLNIILVYQIFN